MPTYNDTVDDLNRKFGRSYIFYDGSFAYIQDFLAAESTGVKCRIKFQDAAPAGPMIVDPKLLTPFTFDTMFINATDLKIPDDPKVVPFVPCVLFRRSARRQYRRGLCPENTYLTSPLGPLYGAFNKTIHVLKCELSIDLFNRMKASVYPKLAEALQSIDTFQCIALSEMFALCLSSVHPTRYLLASSYGTFIGEVEGSTILVKHQPALQEVKDYVKRTKQPIEVIHA